MKHRNLTYSIVPYVGERVRNVLHVILSELEDIWAWPDVRGVNRYRNPFIYGNKGEASYRKTLVTRNSSLERMDFLPSPIFYLNRINIAVKKRGRGE